MAASSLSRLSVPTLREGNQTLLMPKLQFRFRVNFFNFGTNGSEVELTKQVIDVARPQVQFEEIDVPVYNSRVYLAGRHQWQPITLNVRDDQSNEVARLVAEQNQKQLDFFEQSSARAGEDYKFRMSIDMLDGANGGSVPLVIDSFDLVGCFLQQTNYNNVNYGTNEVVQIALTIRYDNAIQTRNLLGAGGQSTGVGS